MRKELFAIFGILALIGCGDCGDPQVDAIDAGCSDCDAGSEPDMPDSTPDLGELTDCWAGPDGGFCRTEFCSVVVEPDTFANPVQIRVREDVPPTAVAPDVVGGRTCVLEGFPEEPQNPITLSIQYLPEDIPEAFDEDELVGAVLDPALRAVPAAHDVVGKEFAFSTTGYLEALVSALPDAPELIDQLGDDRFDTTAPDELTRNLSSHRFGTAFHDGSRFYVGSGPRVLIWEAFPSSPDVEPDVVLGRPNLWSNLELTSASNFSGEVRGIWSDGQRLVVSEGHRVLIWNQVPSATYTPADLVLGQPDFTSDRANRGGEVSGRGFRTADRIWSDGARLIVADALNNRFLIWNEFPTLNDQAADVVIGQQDFLSSGLNAGALPVYRARGVMSDGDRVVVASTYGCNCFSVLSSFPTSNNAGFDYRVGDSGPSRVTATAYNLPGALSRFGTDGLALRNGYRVSAWSSFPEAGEDQAGITLGRPDEVLGAPFGRLSAAALASASPNGDVWANDQFMFVADDRRLLAWATLPSYDFQQADLVFGQPSAATNDVAIDYRGISGRTLAQPADVSIAGDVTAIADRANNRVLIVRGALDATSDVVIVGQLSETESSPNGDWTSPSAATLNLPSGVFTDGTRLVVADSGNHRVLIWDQLPTTDGEPADIVLGQPDFGSILQSRGLGDADGDGDADAERGSMHFPSGVTMDGASLVVADTYNHRVLIWDSLPSASDAQPDRVLGQPDFESNDPNRGSGWFQRSASSMARPVSIDADGGSLAVSDSENNRVLIFEPGDDVASVVLGQPDMTTDTSPNWHSGTNIGLPRNPNTLVTDASTLRRPAAVRWTNNGIVVADPDHHRVVEFTGDLSSGSAATSLWGQADFTSREPNQPGLGRTSLRGPEGVAVAAGRLVVADTQNHRVIEVAGGDALFGQPSHDRNGINGSAPAQRRVNGPGGLSVTKDVLWAADRDHHRVVAMRGDEIVQVVGQRDLGGALPNVGEAAPQGWTLAGPSDVWTDGNRLVVADADNHRVLIWNTLPTQPTTPADIVVGQVDFAGSAVNGGQGSAQPTATGLANPQGVFVEGDTLYVADTGNNRVLVFDSIPQSNGAAADAVLCQSDAATNLPNRGLAEPSEGTCAGPQDVLVVDDRLYVADSLNHRLLEFAVGESTAVRVLGQPDFVTRRPFNADGGTDASTFASPSRIAWDGTNLYVVDTGHHRILLFDRLADESYPAASAVLGQPSFDVTVPKETVDGLEGPQGIAVLPQPFRSTRVWVSDSGRDRIVVFDRIARPF